MNAKKRYNAMIDAVEEKIQDSRLYASEAAAAVARSCGMSLRDLNAVLSCLTGMTAVSYVKHRKMMAAYRYLISGNRTKPDMNTAVEMSGLDNQSSFIKKFDSQFGMTPREACLRKDSSLYEEPLYWDLISGDSAGTPMDTAEKRNTGEEQAIFGLSPVQYSHALQAIELQEAYGFSQEYAQIAFEVSQTLDTGMQEAFAFLDSVQTYLAEQNEDGADFLTEGRKGKMLTESDYESQGRRLALDPDYQYLFFQCGLSVSLAGKTLDRVFGQREQFMKMGPFLIYEFAHTEEMSLEYYQKACRYFQESADEEYTEEDFICYLDQINLGVPAETAFSELLPTGNLEGNILFEEEEWQEDPYEEELWQEDWRDEERIDLEFDEENEYYDRDDLDTGLFDF